MWIEFKLVTSILVGSRHGFIQKIVLNVYLEVSWLYFNGAGGGFLFWLDLFFLLPGVMKKSTLEGQYMSVCMKAKTY
jgi:hypothetical protein